MANISLIFPFSRLCTTNMHRPESSESAPYSKLDCVPPASVTIDVELNRSVFQLDSWS